MATGVGEFDPKSERCSNTETNQNLTDIGSIKPSCPYPTACGCEDVKCADEGPIEITVSHAANCSVLPTDNAAHLGLTPVTLSSLAIGANSSDPEEQPKMGSLCLSDSQKSHSSQSDGVLVPANEENTCDLPNYKSLSMPVLRPVDITLVCEGLYVCDYVSLSASGLHERGITLVINATKELPNVEGADSTVEFLKLCVYDVPQSDLAQYFNLCADKIRSHRANGGATLVHCAMGISRSVTICLAYLVKFEGRTLRQAYLDLKKKRPRIRPNEGFWRQLISFEKSLCGKATVKLNVYPGGVIPDVYQAAKSRSVSTRFF